MCLCIVVGESRHLFKALRIKFFFNIRVCKFYVDLSCFVIRSANFFQPCGCFHSLTVMRAFPPQSARLCLLRCAHSQSKLRLLPVILHWRTNCCATLSIPTKVKRYNQFKTANRNLKSINKEYWKEVYEWQVI